MKGKKAIYKFDWNFPKFISFGLIRFNKTKILIFIFSHSNKQRKSQHNIIQLQSKNDILVNFEVGCSIINSVYACMNGSTLAFITSCLTKYLTLNIILLSLHKSLIKNAHKPDGMCAIRLYYCPAIVAASFNLTDLIVLATHIDKSFFVTNNLFCELFRRSFWWITTNANRCKFTETIRKIYAIVCCDLDQSSVFNKILYAIFNTRLVQRPTGMKETKNDQGKLTKRFNL